MSMVPTIELAPGYVIARVIRGGWQLAGGHGPVVGKQAIDDLVASCDAGLVTLDCADIYTGVEELIGAFREHYAQLRGRDALARLRVHTKFVPDLADLPTLGRAAVCAIIERSLRRLRMERLDLVQFHWWDYEAPGWLDALGWLHELRAEGKVAHIGGTNFDAPHTTAILDAGAPLLTMQVQYSLLDDRPATALAPLAQARGVSLLCYGSVAGGFLSDAWLGREEPATLGNRSLVKYKLIIDDFGGWALFQSLLRTLRAIADEHATDIATVASAAVLDRPGVAAVIVGARDRKHLASNLEIGRIALRREDHAAIDAVLSHRTGPTGDVYTLERDRSSAHGAIMRYDLNATV